MSAQPQNRFVIEPPQGSSMRSQAARFSPWPHSARSCFLQIRRRPSGRTTDLYHQDVRCNHPSLERVHRSRPPRRRGTALAHLHAGSHFSAPGRSRRRLRTMTT